MVRATVNDNIDLCSKWSRFMPQETGAPLQKTSQKLSSTRTKRLDRHPDLFFSRVSHQVRRNSLNATEGVCTEQITGRAHTLTSSRANTTAHHPHISSVGIPRRLKVKRVRVIFSVSHPSRSLLSLLNVPFVRFLSVLSSPTASSSRLSASTTSMASSCRKSPSKRVRSLEWVRPNGWLSVKHKLWAKLANCFSYMDPEHRSTSLTATTISYA